MNLQESLPKDKSDRLTYSSSGINIQSWRNIRRERPERRAIFGPDPSHTVTHINYQAMIVSPIKFRLEDKRVCHLRIREGFPGQRLRGVSSYVFLQTLTLLTFEATRNRQIVFRDLMKTGFSSTNLQGSPVNRFLRLRGFPVKSFQMGKTMYYQ